MNAEIHQTIRVQWELPVLFTRGAFEPGNRVFAQALCRAGPGPHRVLLCLDAGVLAADPALPGRMTEYARAHRELFEFVAAPFVVRGGEVCKAEPFEVGQIHALIERHHLCRQSFVLAVGGGAVLDAVGYAAATAHRGVRLIRMPTTVLAQNDAGVGVKNGVNAFGRKNFLGTFAPPFAVVNDFAFLDTLPARELRAGIAEAVKVAAIRDRAFFDLLHARRAELARFERTAIEPMVFRCAELHLDHIATGGDPFECGSARPLDFGHWSAHKLEEVTGGGLRHGEAVAIGVALDALYSFRVGRLGEVDLARILATLEGVGFELGHWALRWMDVPKALAEFQEHLGGELTITLLDGIGRKVEVHEVDTDLMRACVEELEARHRRRKERIHGHPDLPFDGRRDPGPVLPGSPRAAS